MNVDNKIYKFLKKFIGVVSVIVGIFGLFLPLLQGVLLIVLGLSFLENKYVLEYFNRFRKN